MKRRFLFLSLATAVILGIGGVARAAAPDHPQGQGNGNGPAVTHAPAHQGENDQGPAADPTPGGALTGSVKVDDVDLDDLPANTPHLACQLRVSVQHPNDGPLELTFEAQPPTTRDSGSQVLFDTVVPAGADSSEVVDLTSALAGITAQPEQGFHVKLTVAPVGASDQPAKHKVFWIQACPAPAAAPQVSGSASPEQGAAAPTQVLGEQFTQPAAAPQGELAFTGSPFSPALGMALVAAGLFLLVAVRRPGPALLPVRARRRRG